MKSVTVDEFALALRRGAWVFDVRPPQQVARDGLPGVRHLALEQLQTGEPPDLAPETPLYLLCERGQVSELAGLYLEAAGFREVYNVAGGMIAWRKAGLGQSVANESPQDDTP